MPAIVDAIGIPRLQPSRPRQAAWTYEDYAALPEDGHRYEILEGRLIMSPSPNVLHQRLIPCIHAILHQTVGDDGEVFLAPLDVELTSVHTKATVVQPDVFVVLKANRRARITTSHVIGVPDLVVEVLSPGTIAYDHREKFDAYAQAGLRELWLADPASMTIEVFQGIRGRLHLVGVFAGATRLPSKVLPDLKVTAGRILGGR